LENTIGREVVEGAQLIPRTPQAPGRSPQPVWAIK
jgi:hypothetical protein